MDRNLGASQVATSAIDNLAYGCLYQWGRGNDGHASITRTSSTTATAVNGSTTTQATSDDPGNALFITSTTSASDWRNYSSQSTRWQGVSGVNNPCPSGYRLPTDAEFTAEKTANGISSTATAYSSIFKFVVPGWRSGSGTTINNVGSMAFYWSSTSGNYKNAIIHGFDASSTYSRSFGASVRCIKN